MLKWITDLVTLKDMDTPTTQPAIVQRKLRLPNQTVAMNPKVGKLTTVMRRMFAAICYFSQLDGARESYSRPFSQFAEAANLKRQEAEDIKAVLSEMRRMSIEWNTETAESRRWVESGLLSEVGIETRKDGRGQEVSWSLPQALKDALQEHVYFTPLMLHIVTSLNNGASIALYMICASYRTNPRGVTMRNPWNWWHERLATDKDRFADRAKKAVAAPEYKYFKRDSIITAITEINQLTDINVELIEHKVGRRVVDIQFKVTSKVKSEQTEPNIEAADLVDTPLLIEMVDLGVPEKMARDLASKYPAVEILKAADLTRTRMKSTKLDPLASPGGFFTTALRDSYANAKPKKLIEPLQSSAPAAPQADTNNAEKVATARRKVAYKAYLDLQPGEQEAMRKAYRASRPDGWVFADNWRIKGLAFNPIRTEFEEWFAAHLDRQPKQAA